MKKKNVFLTKPLNDKEIKTFCLKNEKDFKKVVDPKKMIQPE